MKKYQIKQSAWLLVIVLALGATLAACGQSGDLYLPDSKAAQKTHP